MPNLRFAAPREERVAVITGGARGIGRACALRIAEEGRHIVVADLLETEGLEVVQAVEALGQRATFVQTDVSHESSVKTMVDKTIEMFGAAGHIDLLRRYSWPGGPVSGTDAGPV